MFWSYNFDRRENEPLQHYTFEQGFTEEELKKIDLKLYKRLRANELVGSVRNVDTRIDEDEQFEMEL